MTNADVPSISVNELIENPINKNTGNIITSENKKENIIIARGNTWSPDDQNKNTYKLNDNDWFLLKDNITNPSNWKQITYEQAMTGDY